MTRQNSIENFQVPAGSASKANLFEYAYGDVLPTIATRSDLPSDLNFTPDIYGYSGDVPDAMTADQTRAVMDRASGISFTTPAENAQAKQQPDYFLGEDGKLRPNPDKKTPNADASINIELQSKNKSEVDAKKVADQLQKAAIKDLIGYFVRNNKGQKIPQDWLDQLSKEPDLPPAPVPIDTPNVQSDVPAADTSSPPNSSDTTQLQPTSSSDANNPNPAPLESTASSGGSPYSGGGSNDSNSGGGGGSSSGGSGSYGGGGDYNGGGSSHSSDGGSAAANPPRADVSDMPPLKDVPSPTPDGGGLAKFQEAVERANNGGAPISVLQYGDSHIAGGTEPKAIEDALKSLGPLQYDTMAKGGITATYPLKDTATWLDQPIQKNNPDLIILSFGSNEGASSVNQASYEASYQKLIDNIRERAPNASILIVGPSDGDSISGANKGHTLPGLDQVVAAQRDVAAKNGLDFFDLRESMGGPGSVEQWHANGLTSSDKLHFNTKGYELIGNAVANHIKEQVQNRTRVSSRQ